MSDRRHEMVGAQLRARGIRDERVLAAMGAIPREDFVPEAYRDLAYADTPVPIGDGQTISQPYVVAKIASLLEIAESDRVLDVGAGSGYQTAVLAALAKEVWGVEIRPELATAAGRALAHLGIENAKVVPGDGHQGLPEQAPFDAIAIAAAVEAVPPPLFEQLAEGGRLVAPVGARDGQELLRYRRRGGGEGARAGGGELEVESFGSVRFIPFVRDLARA